jgi:RNA polymerase sigma-70 factor (ECF subfamily)
MNDSPLDDLLDRLNNGDTTAAEEIHAIYGPYLQMLVRRQLRPSLRAKFDSMDVVQSVWADVLERVRSGGRRFKDRAHLQAFLVRLARNRFLDRCRKYGGRSAREQPFDEGGPGDAAKSDQPRASEIAQRDELWDQLLTLCPPIHHQLLQLKRQGFSIVEIAARTGLNEGSVRRILYELARRYSAASASSDGVIVDSGRDGAGR